MIAIRCFLSSSLLCTVLPASCGLSTVKITSRILRWEGESDRYDGVPSSMVAPVSIHRANGIRGSKSARPVDSSRRKLLRVTTPALLANIISPKPAIADDEKVFVKGSVSLPAGYEYPPDKDDSTSRPSTSTTSSALYVTCRPDRADNVPAAILNGTRGKPPPVLAARFENPVSFPFSFELSKKDLTVEGVDLWWTNDNLIVSARLDSDGVAATRSPDDLVGRGMCYINEDAAVIISLEGRGAFGKFATKQK